MQLVDALPGMTTLLEQLYVSVGDGQDGKGDTVGTCTDFGNGATELGATRALNALLLSVKMAAALSALTIGTDPLFAEEGKVQEAIDCGC